MRAPVQPRVRKGPAKPTQTPPARRTRSPQRAPRSTTPAADEATAPATTATAAKTATSASARVGGKATKPAAAKAGAPATGKAAPPPAGKTAKQATVRPAIAPRATELAAPARKRPRVSAQFSERLAERRAAVRRLRWRTIGLIAGGLAVLALLVYLAFFSSVLALRSTEVEVTGTTQIVDAEQVRDVLAPAAGTPLARLDTSGLADELASIVGVREAHIQRDWPHGLLVTIEPRIPVASVADGDKFAVLDSDGVVLRRVAEPVEGTAVVDVPLDEDSTAASLAAVLEVLGDLPPELLAEVSTASAPSANQVQFELSDGDEVFWGSSAENALKVQVLATLRQVEATGYDVSAPRAPITTGEAAEE